MSVRRTVTANSPDAFELDDSVAVITGAAGGIGRAAAEALSRRGAAVALFDRAEAPLNLAAEELSAGGAKVTAVVGDVTSDADVARLVAVVEADFGGIDILINSAGVQRRRPAPEFTLDDLDWMWNINVRGVFAVTQGFLPQMIAQGSGRIINVASVGAVRGLEQRAIYALTKGAIAQYTCSLAIELGGKGIRANTLAPGYIETAMTREWLTADPERTQAFLDRIPIGRFGQTADVADVFVFLSSRASDYITGQVLVVDGGWSAS